MKKKRLLAAILPSVLLLGATFLTVNCFLSPAYAWIATSIMLMVTGLRYNGYYLGKEKSPYDFK